MKIPFIKGGLSADKVFDSVANGVDKLVFTQEEKAILNTELAEKLAEYAANTLSENTIRSKARRFISYLIVASWLLAAFVDVFINNADLTYLWKESDLATGFLMVLLFFFGGYYFQHILNMKKKK